MNQIVFMYSIVLLLMFGLVALYRELRREQQAHAAELGAERTQRLALQASLANEYDRRLAEERAQLHASYKVALERVGNTVAYGSPTPPSASIDYEPTPEQSLGRAIEQDTIARGMDALRREYVAANIAVTEQELREEVIAIVQGTRPQDPASVHGLVLS